MTTQVIRNTEGDLTVGTFCQFGAPKPVGISCVGATDFFVYTIIIANGYDDLLMEAIPSIQANLDGEFVAFEDLNNDDSGLSSFEMLDMNYPVPEGFHSTSSMVNVKNETGDVRKLTLTILPQYRHVIRFFLDVAPENGSVVVTNNGSELRVCLAPKQFIK